MGWREISQFSKWQLTGSTVVYTKDGIDLIVTNQIGEYEKFVLSTEIATLLKLRTRNDRVIVFSAILYGFRAGTINE